MKILIYILYCKHQSHDLKYPSYLAVILYCYCILNIIKIPANNPSSSSRGQISMLRVFVNGKHLKDIKIRKTEKKLSQQTNSSSFCHYNKQTNYNFPKKSRNLEQNLNLTAIKASKHLTQALYKTEAEHENFVIRSGFCYIWKMLLGDFKHSANKETYMLQLGLKNS